MNSLVRAFFRVTLLPLVWILYRPSVLNANRVPESGGVLLISNHVTYIDTFLIYATCPRPVRFVVVSNFMKVRVVGWFMRLFGAIPIQPSQARDAIRQCAEALEAGDVVGIFPEGQLTRTGVLAELKKGFGLIARRSGAPVVPLYVDGSWASIFSFEHSRYFRKIPRGIPSRVRVAFGEPVPAKKATRSWAQRRLLELSAEAFGARRELSWSLAEASVRGLKKRPWRACFIDHGKRRRRLRRSQILSIALALSARWKISLPKEEDRIGVLLPSGWTPALLNLALVFSGRVPVNLAFEPESFDAGKLAKQLGDAGIRTVVTSRAFATQLAEFPWEKGEGQFVDVAAELGNLSLFRVLAERILAWIEPSGMAVRRLGVKLETPRESAAAGGYLHADRGAVVLTDRELIGNLFQLTAGMFLEPRERIFCEEPLNTAAGMLFTVWAPILRNVSCSGRSFASRSDSGLIESVVRQDRVSLIVARYTLFRELADLESEWHPELKTSTRAIFHFPEDVSESTGLDQRPNPVESKTGAPVCLGWSDDSLGRILALSVPNPNSPSVAGLQPQTGRRAGSVGRLLPGTAPFIGEKAGDLAVSGPLSLRGGSFDGETPVETGWIARIDGDGFLFLESRPPR